MSNLKHTPEPWIIEENDNDTEWIRFPDYYIDSGEVNIAQLFDTENDANARLIAAAPDMLKALIKYREYIPDTFEMESGIAYVDSIIESATGMKIQDIEV
jgi:hypothetical protein